MENKLYVSLSPHIKNKTDVKRIMYAVVIALLPAWIMSIYLYGARPLWLTLVAIATAVITEAVIQKLRKVKLEAFDGSAVLTGMLLAFNIPPDVPWWIPVIGSIFAIAIAKQAFGGLGYNIFNPALAGRIFLMISFPVRMTTKWLVPKDGTLAGFSASGNLDAVTGSTPLTALKLARNDILANAAPEKIELAKRTVEHLYEAWPAMFFGKIGGCIGETSAIALLLGGIFLIALRIVDYRIPLSYIASVAVFGWMFGGVEGFGSGNIPFQLFSGGLMLGALFMATDMVTSPVTRKGRWIFGIGCGLLTVIIRRWGAYPEGVSFAIFLMNMVVPIIDRHTVPKKYGAVKK
ncbi:MAG: RnfABCDGE type electron transport complex subunit D [Candidatus Zixiibacteriota bacterium]